MTHPHLMAFFATDLTQGPNLRFPNLHVTQSIQRPQLGAPGGRVAKTAPREGAVRCRGKVVAKCYGCDRAALCAAHKDGLCVPCHEATLRNFLRHCLYFSWGIMCPLICYTADCVSAGMMTIGPGSGNP